MTEILYDAPPTCAAFMKSNSFGRLIAGPVGSGKTTACLFEIFRRSCEQHPAPDGLRYTRWAITRQTLKQLEDTVLKDITSWLKDVATYKISNRTIYIEVADVRSEWLLIPLDDTEDQRRLLSMQLTGAWMSEAIEMDVGIVSPLAGRCGRYPSTAQGGPAWFGIIADTNMPTEGSDWHKFMALDTPPDWQIFIQPGGMEPNAENLAHLPQTPETQKLPVDDPRRIDQGREYYRRFVRSNTPDWCRRYVYAQYGDDPSGMAVFKDTFKQSFHVVDDIEPVYGHPLLIGQDFGRDPWSVICQLDHKGRLLVIEEVPAENIGLEKHIVDNLRPVLLSERYFKLRSAVVGDPAGRAKDNIYEVTSFDVLHQHGLAAIPAPTNDIEPRLQAVEYWLLRQADGGPGMVISRRGCPGVIRGLSGGYRYARTRAGQRKPKPDKNEYSHRIDALQYVCLGARGGAQNSIIAHYLSPQRVVRRAPFSSRAWT